MGEKSIRNQHRDRGLPMYKRGQTRCSSKRAIEDWNYAVAVEEGRRRTER